jgi:co-chaperonin GroES (HSP10)
MKITDLAAIAAVSNHIKTVMNDTSASVKDDFKSLNKVRIALDKKFIEAVKELNVKTVLPNELTIVKVGGNGYTPTEADLENWRRIFEEAKSDPDFKIFTHDQVSVTNLEFSPGTEVRVTPAVEPRTIEVSRDVSVVQKGQLTLPLKEKDDPTMAEVLAMGNTTESEVKAAVEEVSKGDVDKLAKNLDNLEEQGVKLTPAVVEEAVKPIKAPEEQKRKVVKKAEGATKRIEDDPEFQEVLKRQKAMLKKEGRSNKKVKRSDETKEG